MSSVFSNPMIGSVHFDNKSTLRECQLLIEYKNLTNPLNCPSGFYLLPSENIMVWNGVFFIHRGYYKEFVIKFRIEFRDDIILTVKNRIVHPLIHKNGQVNLQGYKGCVSQLLHYFKSIFQKRTLDSIDSSNVYNQDIFELYHQDRKEFLKIISECAQISSQELFDPDEIQFKRLDDEEFSNIKSHLIKNGTTTI